MSPTVAAIANLAVVVRIGVPDGEFSTSLAGHHETALDQIHQFGLDRAASGRRASGPAVMGSINSAKAYGHDRHGLHRACRAIIC
jgi:hypothetical protein